MGKFLEWKQNVVTQGGKISRAVKKPEWVKSFLRRGGKFLGLGQKELVGGEKFIEGGKKFFRGSKKMRACAKKRSSQKL